MLYQGRLPTLPGRQNNGGSLLYSNQHIGPEGQERPPEETASAMLRLAYVSLQGLLEEAEQAGDRRAATLRRISSIKSMLDGAPLYVGGMVLEPYIADREQLMGRVAFLRDQCHYDVKDGRKAWRAYTVERMRFLIEIRNILGGGSLVLAANENCPGFTAKGSAVDYEHDPRRLEGALYTGCLPEAGIVLVRDGEGVERQAHMIVLSGDGRDRFAYAEGVKLEGIAYPALDTGQL